jgi:flavin reductase (DIM6/NTAB) family NADH-FMN oxidoreductase RutF
MDFNIADAQKLTSPNPFCLITSRKPGSTTNIMALSWWTYASNHPATLAIFLSQKGYSSELIKETGEFGLSVVDASLKEAAFKCGTCSGREMNKAEAFGIELMDSEKIDTQLVKAHRVAFECRLIQILPVQDHYLLVGEIVALHCGPAIAQLYAMDGYQKLDTIS